MDRLRAERSALRDEVFSLQNRSEDAEAEVRRLQRTLEDAREVAADLKARTVDRAELERAERQLDAARLEAEEIRRHLERMQSDELGRPALVKATSTALREMRERVEDIMDAVIN